MYEKKNFLGLGSNIGSRLYFLKTALMKINDIPTTKVINYSSVYESEPVGFTNQANFLNMVVQVSTEIPPEEFLFKTQKIENDLGRVRKIKWGPRTIDIDILFWGEQVVKSDSIEIPHPEVERRDFVLIPLCEIAPDFKTPISHCTIEWLCKNLKKNSTRL